MDPGLRLWLRYVEDSGGLAERTGAGTLVMLPPPVAAEFDLPTELVVTSDPNVAREDGTVLLSTGHPVLIRAAPERSSQLHPVALAQIGPDAGHQRHPAAAMVDDDDPVVPPERPGEGDRAVGRDGQRLTTVRVEGQPP